MSQKSNKPGAASFPTIQEIEDVVKKLGFESLDDFHLHTGSVDISTPEKEQAFDSWKANDLTKEGLMKLPKLQSIADERYFVSKPLLFCIESGQDFPTPEEQ